MRNLNEVHNEFTGSETVRSYGFFYPKMITEGVKTISERTETFWFLDLILSHQGNPKLKDRRWQTWILKRLEGDNFIAECSDGDGNVLVSQKLSSYSFDYDQYTLWLVDGVIMLPSEY